MKLITFDRCTLPRFITVTANFSNLKLISYRYSSCCSCFRLLGQPLQKSPRSRSWWKGCGANHSRICRGGTTPAWNGWSLR